MRCVHNSQLFWLNNFSWNESIAPYNTMSLGLLTQFRLTCLNNSLTLLENVVSLCDKL